MNKILILSNAYFPYVGGAEIAVKEITGRIDNFDFDMLTARLDRKLAKFERVGNINVYRIGFGWRRADKYIFTFLGFFKAAKLHIKNKYQIIWPIMAAYSSFAVLFKIFFPKVRLLLTLQEGDPIEYIIGLKRFRIFRPIYKIYFRCVDKVQVISNFLAIWAENLGIKKEKIEVIPNGVDIQNFQFQISDSQLNELKHQLNIKDGEKVIIHTGRFVPKNGLEDLIGSINYLPSQVKILLIGEGPDEKTLKNLVKDFGLEQRIIFVGQKNHQDLPQYLKIADVFVRPSLSEGLGNSFLEAMAAGIPIIGTPVGGISDFLRDGDTGIFCEINNPKSIAEKIKLILENDDLRQKIVTNARELVLKNYDWDLIAGKMENIFNKSIVQNGKKQIKILITTGIFPPEIGGPATMVERLAFDLARDGFLVTVLTYGAPAKKSRNFKLFSISRGWLAPFRQVFFLLATFWLALDKDIIYTTDLYSPGYSSMIAAKLWRKKFVVRFAGDSAWETAQNLDLTQDDILTFQKKEYGSFVQKRKKQRAKILNSADGVVVMSEFMKNLAMQIGVNEEKIKVIYNAVDFFDDTPERKKPERPTLVYSGRLTPWKGVEMLIRAVGSLKENFSDILFEILGDGSELEELKKLTQDLKLEQNIKFRGRVSEEESHQIFACSTIFVLNTNYEGLSHAILNAMKVGLPVITTPAGGNPEVIQNEENGLLVSYNSQQLWESAIERLLLDENLQEKFAKNAKKTLERFKWEDLISKTGEFIKKICDKK